MLDRCFAVVCDAGYFPGLRALLNSVWTYHGDAIPVFLYQRGLNESQLAEVRGHPLGVRLVGLEELPFPSPGMWEAKQQVFAHGLGRVRCVYLLDADLVLTSDVTDVFELAEAGQIVSSADGGGITYDASYAVYGPRLPGTRHPYLNSGALCLDVVRHWDLAGLWAFASKYGEYSPEAGAPLGLPGHGDQGTFNAIAALLDKPACYHVLPMGSWCDSASQAVVRIRRAPGSGALEVWNETDQARQRLVHSTGPKWWTEEGRAHLERFGDKLRCFEHFANLACARCPAPAPVRKLKAKVLIGICSCHAYANRRAAVRETWLARLPAGLAARFFVGAGPRLTEEDVVALPLDDNYEGLPRKVQAFCQHALAEAEFDYLFKCDDDTYVVPERLAQLARRGLEFVGTQDTFAEGFASGGAGYLLSRAAVEVVAAAPAPDLHHEDVRLTQLLVRAGFKLTPSPRLRWDHREFPQSDNDLITAHWCSPELMRAIHRGLTQRESLAVVKVFHARHAAWEGPLRLLRNGLFVGGADRPDGLWEWAEGVETLVLNWFHWPAERLRKTPFGYDNGVLRLELRNSGRSRQRSKQNQV